MDKAARAQPADAAAGKGRGVYRIVIDGAQQAIFDELTSLDRPLAAIFNSRMAFYDPNGASQPRGLRRGGRIQMRTVSGKHVIVDGDILEFDPPHRFVHTHRFTGHDDPVCIVTYELKPVAGGIEVTLTVDDLPLGTQTAKEMERGGMFILNNLKAIVERGQPPLSTRLMYWMFGAMEFVLPKKSRTENWPLEGRK